MPRDLRVFAEYVGIPELPILVTRFLLETLCETSGGDDVWDTFNDDRWEDTLHEYEITVSGVWLFHSMTLQYNSTKDIEGNRGGKHKEIIRANPYYRGHGRFDCALIETNPEEPGMSGLDMVQVMLLFSVRVGARKIPMALVQWFRKVSGSPDKDTGMWIVEREYDEDGFLHCSVVHLNSIFRSVHLVPVFGPDPVSTNINRHATLRVFTRFFVNTYSDYHIHETLYDLERGKHSNRDPRNHTYL